MNSEMTTRSVTVRVHVTDGSAGLRRYIPGAVELVLPDGTVLDVSSCVPTDSIRIVGGPREAVKVNLSFYGAIEYVEHAEGSDDEQ